VSKRITVTMPDEFGELYEKLVDANPRASSSEVVQEALIALARSRSEGKSKKKGKGKRKLRGKLPEVVRSRQDMTRARRTRQRRRGEHADGVASDPTVVAA
jgi:Arc/MetJ-type ribon-helix-helix transcriptional regulator